MRSKMLKITPNDDYTPLAEFEHGNKLIFNMSERIKAMPYGSLQDLARFKDITLEKRAIRRPGPVPGKKGVFPLRVTDDRLFAIRE